MTPMRTLALALVAAAACTAEPTEVDCKRTLAGVTGGVTSSLPAAAVDRDLDLAGSATDEDGLAIRRVAVAGVAAHNDGFNFDHWSVKLPIAMLSSLARAADGEVDVKLTATDACDNTYDLQTVRLTVDPTPGVSVTALALATTLPPPGYLPADGSAAAIVTLTANPEARDALVTLATNLGAFSGVDGSSRVRLSGDGTGGATGTVLFRGDRAGVATISATAENRLATASITVAGAPTLIPALATLAPGQTVVVTVLSDGSVSSCQAAPTTGITVFSGGANIMVTPAANDSTGDGHPDIAVTASSPLTAQVQVAVSCRDPFGQSSTGTYTARP